MPWFVGIVGPVIMAKRLLICWCRVSRLPGVMPLERRDFGCTRAALGAFAVAAVPATKTGRSIRSGNRTPSSGSIVVGDTQLRVAFRFVGNGPYSRHNAPRRRSPTSGSERPGPAGGRRAAGGTLRTKPLDCPTKIACTDERFVGSSFRSVFVTPSGSSGCSRHRHCGPRMADANTALA